MRASRRVWLGSLVGLLLVAGQAQPAAGQAAAASSSGRRLEGIVVQATDSELIIDLGRHHGLPDEAWLAIYRRVVVEHPVSRARIEDRFPIGQVQVSQRGLYLSIAQDTSRLGRAAAVSDFVVFDSGLNRPLPFASAESAPPGVSIPVDEAAARISGAQESGLDQLFQASLGRPLPERIQLFEAYLRSHPKSPYNARLLEEVAFLQRLSRQPGEARGRCTPAGKPPRWRLGFNPPQQVETGASMEMAIALSKPELVEQVRLLARHRGQPGFRTLVMEPDGDHAYRVPLPREMLARTGRIQYFLEAARKDGKLSSLVANAEQPRCFAVEPAPRRVEQRVGRSRAALVVEHADFYRQGDAADELQVFELSFRYRVETWVLDALRVGVGNIDGEGGRIDDVEAGKPSRSLSLSYGFAELELGPWTWFGINARFLGGNHHGTERGVSTGVFGLETRLRIGRGEATRLVLGLASVQDLGNQAFTDIHIEVFPRFPIRAGATVTNLPVDEDLGVRISVEPGWRARDWLAISLVTGINARTINHFGFTLGGGLSLDW